jgi:hypothetical protein
VRLPPTFDVLPLIFGIAALVGFRRGDESAPETGKRPVGTRSGGAQHVDRPRVSLGSSPTQREPTDSEFVGSEATRSKTGQRRGRWHHRRCYRN